MLVLAALVSAGCGSNSSTTSSHRATTPDVSINGSMGPEGIPLEKGAALAAASSTAPGIPVDGIQCAPLEQLAYHIHARLQVYVDGQPRSLPGGIGMVDPVGEPTKYGPFFYAAGGCYYWLHTHASDGVIHIESPTVRVYTLGDFFDEWGQPLASTRVASASGNVTALVNGQPWTKSPRAIPLLPHEVIQLDVGSPAVPFGPVSWAGTNL